MCEAILEWRNALGFSLEDIHRELEEMWTYFSMEELMAGIIGAVAHLSST